MNGSSIVSAMAARVLLAVWLVALSGATLANVNCDSGSICTQTIELNPGWNAIYVQVEPEDVETEDHVAAALRLDSGDNNLDNIESIWMWVARRAKIDFIQEPDPENMISSPGWLRYFPSDSTQAFLTNLHAISANRAYLIKLAGSNTATLTISGKPAMPRMEWEPNAFNLTGFHVDPANEILFADFLAGSPAHQGQDVYQLVDNQWREVNQANTSVEPGKAYWIFSKGGSDYSGPLTVEIPQITSLEYGASTDQNTLRFKSWAPSVNTVTVKIAPSTPGFYQPVDNLDSSKGWSSIEASTAITLEQNSVDGSIKSGFLKLGLRRADLPEGQISTVLDVTGGGSRWLIPVRGKVEARIGLWLATVTLDHVSEVHNYRHNCLIDPNDENAGTQLCLDAEGFPLAADNELDKPVSRNANFSFRAILHDDGQQLKLLKDVILMRDEVSESARYVLLTDDTKISQYSGVQLRDGELVGRRISTAAYDFPGESLLMEGDMASVATAQISLANNASTNPFRHVYHSDHGKGYPVTRTMKFEFSDTGSTDLSAGYDQKTGSYREVVNGLHKWPIVASGTFTLQHVAQISTLNE